MNTFLKNFSLLFAMSPECYDKYRKYDSEQEDGLLLMKVHSNERSKLFKKKISE